MAEDIIGKAVISIDPDFGRFQGTAVKEGERLGRLTGDAFAAGFMKAIGNLTLIPPATVSKATKTINDGFKGSFDQVNKDAKSTGDTVAASLGGAARDASAAMTAASKGTPFSPVADDAKATGEKVKSTFSETAKSVDTSLRQRGADGRFKPIETDAQDAESGIRKWFNKAGDAISSALHKSSGDAKSEFSKMEGEAKSSGSKIGASLFSVAAAYGAVRGIQAISRALKESVDLYQESAQIGRVTEAVVKSTGGAANVSAKQIGDLSTKLSMQTGIDDEVIQSSSNVLLTFKAVANQSGKNNDIFTQTQKAALDMSTVMGGDAAGAATMLGKALNDPEKGMTKLMRSGVTFTDQQKEQVKTLQASGDMLGAQKIILKEVQSEFGGAAEAAANPMMRLKVITDNLKESFGKGLVGALDPLADAFMNLAPAIEPVITALGTGIGGVISALTPLIGAIAPVLTSMLGPLLSIFELIGGQLAEMVSEIAPVIGPLFTALAAAATPLIEVIGGLVGTLLPPFISLITILAKAAEPVIFFFEMIADTLLTALTPVMNALMPVLVELGNMFTRVFGSLVDDGGPMTKVFYALGDALVSVAPIIGQIATVLAQGLGEAFKVLGPIIGDLVAQLAGGFAKVLPLLLTAFLDLTKALMPLLPAFISFVGMMDEAFVGLIVQVAVAFAQLVGALVAGIVPILPKLIEGFIAIGKALESGFKEVLKAILPILPDLVNALVEMALAFVQILPALLPLVPLLVQMIPPLVRLVVPVAELAAKMLSLKPVLYGAAAAFVAYKIATKGGDALTAAAAAASWGLKAAQMAQSVATGIATGAQTAFNTVMAVNPIILVVAAIAALAAGFYLAYKHIGPFHDAVDAIGRFFRDTLWPVLQQVGAFLGDVLGKAFEFVKDRAMMFLKPIIDIVQAFQALIRGDFSGFFKKIGDAFMDYLKFITDIPMKILGLLGKLGGLLVGWLSDGFSWLAANGPGALASFAGWVGGLAMQVVGWLGDLGGKLLGWISDGFMAVVRGAPGALASLGTWLLGLPGTILGFLGNLGVKLLGWFADAFLWVASNLANGIAGFIVFLVGLPLKIIGWLGTLGYNLVTWFVDAFTWVVTNAPGMLAGLATWLGGLAVTILGWLGDIGGKLLGWFVDGFMWVMSNLASGLASFIVWLVGLPLTIIGWIGTLGYYLVTWFIDGFMWVVTNGPGILAGIGAWLVALPGTIMGWLGDIGSKLLGWITAGFTWIATNGAAVIESLGVWLRALPGTIISWLADLGGKLFEWAKAAFNYVGEKGSEILSSMTAFVKSIPGRVIDGLGKMGSKIYDWMKEAFDFVADNAPKAFDRVLSFFKGLPGKLIDGISTGLSAAGGAVADIAGKLWGALKGFVNEKLLDPIREKKISIGPYDAHPFSFLPRLAQGAIVDSPTTVLVGEDGPEVVIPLTKPDRAAKLLKESGLADMASAAGSSSAVAAAVAPGVDLPDSGAAVSVDSIPLGVGAAGPTTSGTDNWFTSFTPKVIAALKDFGAVVWAGVGPSFVFLQTTIQLLFQGLLNFIVAFPMTAWTLMAPNLAVFTVNTRTAFETMSRSIQASVAAMSVAIQGSISYMSTQVLGTYSKMIASLTSTSTTGGAGVVAALRAALVVGTTEVQTIVHGYAVSLADSLNPVLRAIGQKDINVKAFAEGGVNDPRIVPDGAYDVHVFGEQGTHGEAYIPFKPSLRARSRGIASETVRRLGGEASWFGQGGVTGDTKGLNPEFLKRLGSWSASVGQTYNVGSGYRSMAEQVRLYQRWLAHVPGQALAAPPGKSNHNFGLASDGSHWRDKNPGAFGLRFPMGFEPWHVEPVEAKQWRAMMPDTGWAGNEAMPGAMPTIQPLAQVVSAGTRGILSDTASKAMSYAYDQSLAWAGKQTMASATPGTLADSAGGVPMGPAAAQAWINQAIALTGVPQSWAAGLLTIAKRESNFNPRAINLTDSNAKKGIPSKGLMQTIDPTFRQYMVPGHGDIYNPVDNAAAAIRYILKRYGDISKVQQANPNAAPKGYADGAIFDQATSGIMGEAGKEVLIPLTRPLRALQLAMDSGLMSVLDRARAETGVVPASASRSESDFDGGFLGGKPGNTYIIHGIGMDQVMAEIRAHDEAVENVRG